MNLEYELYRQVMQTQKAEPRPDDALFALHNVIEVQRKLDITEAIEREKESRRKGIW